MSVTATQLESRFAELALERTGSDTQRRAMVYADLKRIAHRVSGRVNPGDTLQTTALLHEAWLQLAEVDTSELESRNQFLGMAATVIHRIAVDHVREKTALKRGGDWQRVPFETAQALADQGQPDELVLSLHEAIERIRHAAPQSARMVELLFFVGLTHHELAQLWGKSQRTIRREWRKARALLYQALHGDHS